VGNNLVIVESPTKATTIQKFLGSDYTVMSCRGHIRDLQEKKLSVDIENGFKPEYVIPADKKKIVSDLRKLASKADVVWLASDEDREGEAISWHLVDTLGLDKDKTRRIVFHEITKNAILGAVKTPRDIDMSLVNAQQARRVLDRLVGFELSPVLWRKIQRGLSAGRVQSVTLRLVVDREREIAAFNHEAYYRVEAVFKFGSTKVKGVLDKKFSSAEEARLFLNDSIGANYGVCDVEEKEGTKSPAAPFTTSTLQQEAGRKLHFPVSLTMRVAQSLYERGLITYMRTDSTNLSSLALATSKKFITEQFGEEYSRTRNYKTHSKGAQEAHEAIRPTFIENTSIEGSAQEKKLYELIWKRTVASQMADAKVLNTTVKVNMDRRPKETDVDKIDQSLKDYPEYDDIESRPGKYAIQASRVLFDGFLKLYFEGSDDDNNAETVSMLPKINVGDTLSAVSVNADCKYTQAPPRYSEMTLIKKMEELGIGRPSTYAPTISTLTTGRGYLVKGDKEGKCVEVRNFSLKGNAITETVKTETVGAEKGKLLPQDIGLIVCDCLVANFPDLMSYDFTANVEKDFDEIAEGHQVWNEVIARFYTPFHSKIDEVINDRQYSHVERELGVDSKSGQKLVAKFGQYGPYVQKGEGEGKQFASLGKDQLIESITLEDALKLFELPRTVGQYEGSDIVAMKGRFGPYLHHGDRNVSIPRGKDPLKISLNECIALLSEARTKAAAVATPIKEWTGSDISVINGRYGPYIKHAGSNYKIPAGTDVSSLTEEACRQIVENSQPTDRKSRKFGKK